MNRSFYIGNAIKPHLEEWLRKTGAQKILLVRGKSSFDTCGASTLWNDLSKESGFPASVHFFDFQSNPQIEDSRRGVALGIRENIDAIVGIGGGSVLDMAKLIRHFHHEQTGKCLPLLAMPTTAGTGAEATHFAVCYIDGEKTSVSHENISPDLALIYPPFTYKNDAYLTACTGFDAVAQAIESYWSVNADEKSQEWSLQALAKLWQQLPALIQNPENTSLRDDIAEGAYYAGRAIDLTTTTAAHAFSYKFTSLLNYPHGHAVALTFPFWFARNTSALQELSERLNPKEYAMRIKKLLEAIGCQEGTVASRKVFMEGYLASIGLLKGHFNTESLTTIINTFNAERAKNNPTVINESVKKALMMYLA